MNYLTLHFFQREVLVEFQEKKHQFVIQKIIYFLLDVKTIWLGGKAYPHFP